MSFERVCVVGLGYIGLPTAAMFASRKVKVVGVDISQKAVDTINAGKVHIVEPGLDLIVRAVVSEGYLRATTKPEPADAFLIAVPTPFKEDHQPDLSYIEAACKTIAPVLAPGNLIILESTSPVGATQQMVQWLSALRPDLGFPREGDGEAEAAPDINIAYCPERVLPGKVVRELVENDRIIGGMTTDCAQRAISLYRTFVEGECISTSTSLAEMTKLTENSFRDVNIAFANEMSILCDELNIDVFELIRLANRHPRVNILQPGTGVGGHCIAVDPWFIISKHPQSARLLATARDVNAGKPAYVATKIDAAMAQLVTAGKQPSDIVVSLLGLAFKPDIDDLRESPAMDVARHVLKSCAGEVLISEPNIEQLPGELNGAALVTTHEALKRSDIVAVLVSHSSFKGLGLKSIDGQIIIDAVGI